MKIAAALCSLPLLTSIALADGSATKTPPAKTPTAAATAPDVRIGEPVVTGGTLDTKTFGDVVGRRRQLLLGCYRTALEKDPTLRGDVSAELDVTASGAVAKPTATDTGTKLSPCVRAQLAKLTFAKRKDKSRLHIAFTLSFDQVEVRTKGVLGALSGGS